MQRIADEADVSKATIYHHFDDKDELMFVSFETALSRIGERATQLDITDPMERLHVLIDRLLLGELPQEISKNKDEDAEVDVKQEDPLAALIDIRTQAIHDAKYRDHVSRIDRVFEDQLASDIAEAVEEGTIREVEPERTAKTLYTLVLGGFLRRTTTDDADLESVREDADLFIDGLHTD
ncbi:TetR/AcrR family transcriptional regulator [Haladaptatus sp. AB643]|nr:TetR/AcrR family transcriptional regulator [Haladaptatus sp. AB643]MCO8255996.1 TetR/AcrR family transcriptional regulator [Haladaptatus sp. AB618]